MKTNRCVGDVGGARAAHLPAGQLLHKSIRMSPYAVALCSSRLEIRGPSRRLRLPTLSGKLAEVSRIRMITY